MTRIEQITKIPDMEWDKEIIHEQVGLGNGTAITMLCFIRGGTVHLAVVGHGYYTFTHYVHPGYLCEKVWNNKFRPDAEVVANWLNKTMGWE